MVFVTLTAPSFGLVHSLRHGPDGQARRCRPRRDAPVCEHGVRISCGERHDEHDPCLGEPLCPDCYDHAAAVIWNNSVGELWRCTTIYLRRHIARHAGLTQADAERRVVPAYAKVGEYHKRGLVHLHALVRLDRAMPDYRRERDPPARRAVQRRGARRRRCAPPSARSTRRARSTSAPRASSGARRSTCARCRIVGGRRARRPATWPSTPPRAPNRPVGSSTASRPPRSRRVRVRPHVRAHLRAAFELHAQAEPQADAVRRAHAAATTAEAREYPPAADDRHPDELAHRARQATRRDERVRIRLRGERRQRRGRITACATAEPRDGTALALVAAHRRAHPPRRRRADRARHPQAARPPRPAARCVRAPVRPPRPLPDQEPPLRPHPHRAARSAPRTRRPPPPTVKRTLPAPTGSSRLARKHRAR